MKRAISGFEWDSGNWPKCAKHGLTKAEIEQVFIRTPSVYPDPNLGEDRKRAIGTTAEGRYVFVVFTLRESELGILIRPISARYMHEREIRRYEQR
jgi:uncharacterized DUF497 family protein